MLYCMVYFLQKKDTNAAKGQHIIETKHPKSAHNISEKNPTSPKPPSPPAKSEATAKRIGIAEKTNDKGTTSTLVIRFKTENSNYLYQLSKANTITAHDEKKPKQISKAQSNKPDSSINAATNSNGLLIYYLIILVKIAKNELSEYFEKYIKFFIFHHRSQSFSSSKHQS